MGEVLAQQQRLCPPPPSLFVQTVWRDSSPFRCLGLPANDAMLPLCRQEYWERVQKSWQASRALSDKHHATTSSPKQKVSRDPATTLPEASADLHVPPSTELSCLLGGQHELFPNHRSGATLTPPLLRAHVFFFFFLSRLFCLARATKNLRLKGLLLLSLSCGGEAAGSLAPRARVQLPSVPVQAGFLDGDLVVALPSASSDK